MSLFGNKSNNNSGGLFGNSNNSSGGLFSSNNNNSSGGLFGNKSNTNNNSSGGLFGNKSNNNSGGLFGGNNNNSSGSGNSFGNKSGGSGLFGNNNNNNNNSNSLFGNKNNNSGSSLFGNNKNNNSGNSLFGSNNNNSGNSLFGNNNNSNSNSLFGNNNNNNSNGSSNQFIFPQTSSSNSTSVSTNPVTELQKFYNAYNPKDQNFQFDAILYSKPAQNFNTKQYMKPPDVSQHLWDQANKQNPDPDKLTPVFIKGFDQLHKRAEALAQASKQVQMKKKEMRATIENLKQKHQDTKNTIKDMKRDQLSASLKLLQVVRQILVSHNGHKPLTNHEMVYRQRLSRVRKDLAAPSKFISRSNEALASAQASRRNHQNSDDHLQFDTTEVSKMLKEQLKMIRELVNNVTQDKKELDSIEEDLRKRRASAFIST